MDIYCFNCRNFYSEHHHIFGYKEACLSNPEIKKIKTHYKTEKILVYADPSVKNKNNDCKEHRLIFFELIKSLIKKFIKLMLSWRWWIKK